MIIQSPTLQGSNVSAKTKCVCSLRSAPRPKKFINWRGSRLLYIFRVLVGKDIVKIGIDWDALILFQSDEIETESTRRPL